MSTKTIDPLRALDQFFSIVREEAASNPRFATRLLDAIGYQVVFRGENAKYALDPVTLAAQGEDNFRSTLLTFSAADLKSMIKDFNLATQADLRGKSKAPQLVELMWAGASAKRKDRGLT